MVVHDNLSLSRGLCVIVRVFRSFYTLFSSFVDLCRHFIVTKNQVVVESVVIIVVEVRDDTQPA